MQSILDAVQKIGAKRLSSIRWPALKWLCRPVSAPTFANRFNPHDLRLDGIGVTILSTV